MNSMSTDIQKTRETSAAGRTPNPVLVLLCGIAAVVLLFQSAGCKTLGSDPDPAVLRAEALRGTRATYCLPPRKPDNRVDVEKLVAELVDLGANTYSFCIHSQATDWDDLILFLPAAQAEDIRVWASIVPPSESYPRHGDKYPEPFRLDYKRWAREFAQLSLQYPNLVAWSIDDFTHNLKDTYTPAYVQEMLTEARAINPKLAFVPCCYIPAITLEFAANYVPLLDGILFPYRHESEGANLKEPGLVEQEVRQIKLTCGESFPVVLDIYATAHSRLGATTPEYVDTAMQAGHRAADGVMIYCHQNPEKSPEKYDIIKRNFQAWADEK